MREVYDARVCRMGDVKWQWQWPGSRQLSGVLGCNCVGAWKPTRAGWRQIFPAPAAPTQNATPRGRHVSRHAICVAAWQCWTPRQFRHPSEHNSSVSSASLSTQQLTMSKPDAAPQQRKLKPAPSRARAYARRAFYTAIRPISLLLHQVHALMTTFLLAVIALGPMPRHIGFVMDGNRRYARSQGQRIAKGHQRGSESLKRVSRSEVASGVWGDSEDHDDAGSRCTRQQHS